MTTTPKRPEITVTITVEGRLPISGDVHKIDVRLTDTELELANFDLVSHWISELRKRLLE